MSKGPEARRYRGGSNDLGEPHFVLGAGVVEEVGKGLIIKGLKVPSYGT